MNIADCNRCISFAFAGMILASQLYAEPPKEIRFWINAFIPETIDGLTQEIPVGDHEGKTGVRVNALSDWYLTDQRDYSNDPEASARVHCEFLLKFEEQDDGSFDVESEEKCTCGPTIKVASDGKSQTKTADVNGGFDIDEMDIEKAINDDQEPFDIEIDIAAANPFVPKPDLDIEGTITIDILNNKVAIDLEVEPFPNFEVYAQVDEKPVVLVAKRELEKGATPWVNLWGNADRELKEDAKLVPSDE